jgi:tetratricopeptide (TPR) repeat protein
MLTNHQSSFSRCQIGEKMANFTNENDANVLMREAQKHLDECCDPEAAVELLRRAAQISPNSPDVFDLLAEVEMSLGECERASQAWMHIIESSGNPNDAAHAERWLYVAQLQEGIAARDSYLQGIRLLQARGQQEQHSQQICSAYCALAELYLTDLCYEDDAEASCQAALDQALQHDVCQSHEPVQGLASLRLSQNRHAEAVQLIQAAYERINAAQEEIDSEMRQATCRLLLECAPYEPQCADAALDLLSRLMQEDDENVEIWFMMGVGFFQQSPPDIDMSQEYLNKAKEMLEKVRDNMGGGIFPHETQLKLVEDQLELVNNYIEEEGNKQ